MIFLHQPIFKELFIYLKYLKFLILIDSFGVFSQQDISKFCYILYLFYILVF